MKKNITNISGVTLIEILIGVVISVVMMAAMFTSYNVVNNTYSKVTDTAKISQAGRETSWNDYEGCAYGWIINILVTIFLMMQKNIFQLKLLNKDLKIRVIK